MMDVQPACLFDFAASSTAASEGKDTSIPSDCPSHIVLLPTQPELVAETVRSPSTEVTYLQQLPSFGPSPSLSSSAPYQDVTLGSQPSASSLVPPLLESQEHSSFQAVASLPEARPQESLPVRFLSCTVVGSSQYPHRMLSFFLPRHSTSLRNPCQKYVRLQS